MSSINQLVWRQPQNTKIPAVTQYLSARVPITANTTGTYQLPSNTSNPVQNTPAQAPGNYAPQQNPSLPNNKPQQGLRFFVTDLVVRDATAALTGAGGSAATVALINVTQGNAVIATLTTPVGTNPAYMKVSVTTGAVVVNPYDQLAVTFTAQGGGTPSTATGFAIDVLGIFQQAGI